MNELTNDFFSIHSQGFNLEYRNNSSQFFHQSIDIRNTIAVHESWSSSQSI